MRFTFVLRTGNVRSNVNDAYWLSALSGPVFVPGSMQWMGTHERLPPSASHISTL